MEILSLCRHKPRIPVDRDADGAVVSRLVRQRSKHCTRFESILKAEDKEGRNRRNQIERAELGNRTELGELEER